MMPPLTTPVATTPLGLRLDLTSQVVSLGSCFADEMANRMRTAGFSIDANPFGTLYNPASIAQALHILVDDRELTASNLVQHENLWHSWLHHGAFSRPTAEETLATCNARIHNAHHALKQANLLIITFGTAWIFEHEGHIVANCHKLPAIHFTRRRLQVGEIVDQWQPLLQTLAHFNPQLAVLFTVSPIRHLADGAHGNQLSKSTLLLAIDQLCSPPSANIPLHYFPAYEILLDELRDYRFYAPDLTHPSPLAADIVWHHLQQATMSPATQQQVHNNTKLSKRLQHIPLHPQS